MELPTRPRAPGKAGGGASDTPRHDAPRAEGPRIPPGVSVDDYMRSLHGNDKRSSRRVDTRLMRLAGVCFLGFFLFMLYRQVGHPGHIDAAARAKMPVVDVVFEDLMEVRGNERNFTQRYGGKLFRLKGVATSVMEQQRESSDGTRETLGPALLMTPDPRSESYLATFYKSETAKMVPVMPGAQVTILCDHLEVVKGKRMEGCTLESFQNS
jgi:hypothetical protein